MKPNIKILFRPIATGKLQPVTPNFLPVNSAFSCKFIMQPLRNLFHKHVSSPKILPQLRRIRLMVVNKRPDSPHTTTSTPSPLCHFPAFTIIEMIVVMVLSGIIIAAALKFYLNYEGLVRGKTKQMELGKETLQFYQLFRHEFDDANRITSTGSRIIFILPEKSPVQYDFEKNYITRLQNNLTDTFFVTVNDLNIRKDEVTGLDKLITMELRNYDEIFPVLLVKEYPNSLMMQIRK